MSQKAAAPIGAAFTLICLVTGSLWGKPMWGTYWQWDARLTSMLVMLLIYGGILALWRAIEEPNRAARAVSILTLVGAVNVPIVKFSVDWWNTLHQPASVFRLDGPTIHASMLVPLLIMALAFTLLGMACIYRACAPRSCAAGCARSPSSRPSASTHRRPEPCRTVSSSRCLWRDALVISGLILRAVIDHRIQVRALADLEARGIGRRSSRRGS